MNCNDKAVRICSQNDIPQVDNSALECSNCGFSSAKCVIIPEEIPYLGLPADSSLDTIVKALLSSLIDARNRIATLESFH